MEFQSSSSKKPSTDNTQKSQVEHLTHSQSESSQQSLSLIRQRQLWPRGMTEEKFLESLQNRRHIRFDDKGNAISTSNTGEGVHIRFADQDDDIHKQGNTDDKKETERPNPEYQPQTGKRIKFDNDGNIMSIENTDIPDPDEVENYRALKNRSLHLEDRSFPDWQTDSTKQEIQAVIGKIKDKVGHEKFYVAHHTFSKAILRQINSKLTDNQRKILAERLSIRLSKQNKALMNLYSNLSIGPYNRIDDPKSGLDATYYQVEDYPNLIIDPRAHEYQSIDQFIRKRGFTHEFSDDEFTQNILKPLEKAEKIHVVLTKGYHINPEVSMWEPVNDNQWQKVPIQIDKNTWKQILIDIYNYIRDDKSLNELKMDFQ